MGKHPFALFLLAGAIFFCSSGFEPDYKLATLTGTITLEERYGPPGYGEDPARDSKGSCYFLTLEKPVDFVLDGTTTRSGFLQVLSLQPKKDYPILKALRGKKATLSGRVWRAQTGHHYTDIILELAVGKGLFE